jgi:hypothetical protein
MQTVSMQMPLRNSTMFYNGAFLFKVYELTGIESIFSLTKIDS